MCACLWLHALIHILHCRRTDYETVIWGDWWRKKTATFCFATQYLSPNGGNCLSQKSKWNCQPVKSRHLSLGLRLLVLLMELELFLVNRMILVSELKRRHSHINLHLWCYWTIVRRVKKIAVSGELNVVLTLNSSIFIK